MSSQSADAFNEAVERRTAELRAALEFYANADNYVGGEVGWWADAPGGEQRWCMDFGSIARSALGSDRPPFFTAQQELALARCEGYEEGFAAGRAAATPDPPDMTNMCEGESPDHKPGITPAASPDERLREAGEQLANLVTLLAGSDGPGYFAAPNQGEHPDYYATAKLFDRIMRDEKTGAAIVLAEWRAALAAADREAPDTPTKTKGSAAEVIGTMGSSENLIAGPADDGEDR